MRNQRNTKWVNLVKTNKKKSLKFWLTIRITWPKICRYLKNITAKLQTILISAHSNIKLKITIWFQNVMYENNKFRKKKGFCTNLLIQLEKPLISWHSSKMKRKIHLRIHSIIITGVSVIRKLIKNKFHLWHTKRILKNNSKKINL